MAYTLTYSGGTITVNDGTLNSTSTSLSLPGRNYSGYGGPVDQNLVSMLENFAASITGPVNPIRGQLWYDYTNVRLKYNISSTGTPTWAEVAAVGNSVTFDNIDATGDITADGSVSGNNIVATTNVIHGVGTYSAAGSNQSGATQIAKDISVITGGSGGVKLPSTAGLRIAVINTLGTTLNVYPAGSGQINALGASAPYAVASGSRLEFVSISISQWYTLNSTYS